jgi:hypothetical protein
MAGTLLYRMKVEHVYQRRFDSDSLAEALADSHWYIVSRRPSVRIIEDSVRVDDQILTADFVTRDDLAGSERVHTLGSDFCRLGPLHDFQIYADGAYFSVGVGSKLMHGDAWALSSLLSTANVDIARQEVLYIGQAFGRDGTSNAWQRTQNHQKLQRIYEDHVNVDCEIFVAPLSLEGRNLTNDDHIDDNEDGPDLSAYYGTFTDWNGRILKPSVDLIEHSLISYFAPSYNEKLKEWRASNPTDAMQKMRSAGFRLLHVHLSGWWGLARFYSSQEPNPLRSHFISQDLPPKPRRVVLRGISAETLSSWRFDAMLAREGKEIFADRAERTGVSLRIFGDQAPAVRKPPGITLSRPGPDLSKQAPEADAHNEMRAVMQDVRKKEREALEPRPHSGESSYDPSTGTISVGQYADGSRVSIRLHDPESGDVDSALILGEPQAGKSNCLRMIAVEAFMTGRFAIVPSDPLNRNGFSELWHGIARKDHLIATDIEATIRNLAMARYIVEGRYATKDTRKPGELLMCF